MLTTILIGFFVGVFARWILSRFDIGVAAALASRLSCAVTARAVAAWSNAGGG